MTARPDESLDNLLLLHGEIFPMDLGFWTKIEAYRVEPSEHIPQGVKYSLTLHDKHNTRVLGFDNAHGYKPVRKKFGAYKTTWDHKHCAKSREAYKERTLAIARGEYIPKRNEPKIWFESVKSMAQVLSNENQELLRVIDEQKPRSIKELESATGRKSSNLSRTLKTLARYGIVDLPRSNNSVRPVVKATMFQVEFGLYPLFRTRTT
jgi:predicted transcriptional regulator